jgi:pimeloyl-ACP methyl ester carboxylesterase
MAAELHSLLNRAGVPGPYVLVGNSLGGLLIRMYAHRYPEEVAGLVLIDAAHEEQFQRLPGSNSPLARPLFRLLPRLVETGIPALFPGLVPVPAQMPEEDAKMFRALAVADPGFAETASAEFAALEESHAQLRAARIKTLGDLPVTVISHGKFSGFAVRAGLISPEKQQQAEQIWLELQGELAAQSSRGKLVVAQESGHNIEFEQPELVIAAIREVLAAGETSSSHSVSTQAQENLTNAI